MAAAKRRSSFPTWCPRHCIARQRLSRQGVAASPIGELVGLLEGEKAAVSTEAA